MKNNKEYHMLGHTLLRVTIGLMFVFAGYGKIIDPSKPIGMVTNLGFPMPVAFAWILILSELIFGAAVLLGAKVKYTVWPLVVVMLVAWSMVSIPSQGFMASGTMFHLVTIAGLVTIALTGPGKWAVTKN